MAFQGFFNKPAAKNGYDHPSLKKAFNDAAQSVKGLAAIDHCKNIGFPLQVTNSLDKKELGICTPDGMSVRPGSGFRTIAHEARHAFQMATLGILFTEINSPLPRHIISRMMEADAHAFTSLVAIERWHTLGYQPDTLPEQELADAHPEELFGLAVYSLMKLDPSWEAQLMRSLFNYHFESLKYAPHYESTYLAAADYLYHCLYENLATWQWIPIPSRADRARMIDEFLHPEKLILLAAEKLGQVLTLETNYMMGSGAEFGPADYKNAFSPFVENIHAEWQEKINRLIARKYTPKP